AGHLRGLDDEPAVGPGPLHLHQHRDQHRAAVVPASRLSAGEPDADVGGTAEGGNMKKNFATGITGGLIAGTAIGLLLASAKVLDAQQTIATAAEPIPMVAKSAPVPGTLTVTRLTDTSFVVVKDQGDQQVITLFSTEG